ncbi:MAG: hypothetical protein BWY55_00956 [archaeon ADurb.Bin336]|jgi:hypothetical protein|nr:MAG: hypothetical protein BWY55_00956 [archaeon ADurb.Bin336]
MKLTEQQKNILTKIKSELIQQDIDEEKIDPMDLTAMANALDKSNQVITNYLQEEE